MKLKNELINSIRKIKREIDKKHNSTQTHYNKKSFTTEQTTCLNKMKDQQYISKQ